MKFALDFAKLTLLLALTVLCVWGTFAAIEIGNAATRTAAVLDTRSAELQRTVTDELYSLRLDVELVATDVQNVLRAAPAIADKQLTAANQTLASTASEISALRGDLSQAIAGAQMIAPSVISTTQRVDRIAARVEETSDLLLDCEGNPNCLANRSIGTMQAIERAAQATEKMTQASERTAQEVAAAVPELLEDVNQMAENSNATTAAAAQTMQNIEKQTKPLPIIVRLAPQIAQLAIFLMGVLK